MSGRRAAEPTAIRAVETAMDRRHWLLRSAAAAGLMILSPARALAQDEGLRALQNFLATVQHGRTRFTQTVTAPPRDGVVRSRVSEGSFEFLRPDRFRFHYTRPYEQLIVADGQTLWLYDPDLNQVTARRQREALANTPAAVLASAADLRAVREAFELSEGGMQDGLHWVEALPRSREGQLQRVRIGFREGQLEVLDILDGFGQRSVLRFSALDRSVPLTPAQFRFQPPAGAEILRP
jgi:outer membrane lipoprotein carrier protein